MSLSPSAKVWFRYFVLNPCTSLERKGPITDRHANEDFIYLGINIVSGFR